MRKYKCDTCGREDFKSQKGVEQHDRKAHPYIPPPPPRKETEVETGEEAVFTLKDAQALEIGDIFWHIRKCVITRRTKTEGTRDIEVVTRVTKRWYTKEKPQ